MLQAEFAKAIRFIKRGLRRENRLTAIHFDLSKDYKRYYIYAPAKHRIWFDLGHPLLNRVADSFVKAVGVGALQAVSREAYFKVVDGAGFDPSSMGPPSENTGSKKHRGKQQQISGSIGEEHRKRISPMGASRWIVLGYNLWYERGSWRSS